MKIELFEQTGCLLHHPLVHEFDKNVSLDEAFSPLFGQLGEWFDGVDLLEALPWRTSGATAAWAVCSKSR